MSSKPILSTLSKIRPRTIDPKIAKLGDLTFLLDKRVDSDGKSLAKTKANLKPNKDTDFLDSIASRSPTDPLSTKLIKEHLLKTRSRVSQPRLERTARPTRDAPLARQNSNQQTRRSPLPDPMRSLAEKNKDLTQYRRPIASLDKLAAQSGVDSSTDTIRKRRTYTDRLSERPQPSTRFALPRRAPGDKSKQASRTSRPMQKRERQPNKAQEQEAERQKKILARQETGPAAAVPYEFNGLSAELDSLTVPRTYIPNMRRYEETIALQEASDAARLVVGNRSITHKSIVLDKIGTWIPDVKSVESRV